MANKGIDLYHFSPSPPSRSVLLLMKALGLKANIKTVNIMAGEQMKPEFLKLNPMHTIPVINDDGFVLWDSQVIMKYLVDQYAKDDSLFPRDAKRGAIVNQILYYNACCLFPRMTAYCMPVFQGHSPDEEKAAKIEEALEYLDGFLKNQIWVAGQYLTIADFSVIAVIASLEAISMFNLHKYQNMWAWYQRTKSAMASYGYDEVNQAGADVFGGAFKSKLK